MPKRKAAKNKRGGAAKKESIQSTDNVDVTGENVIEGNVDLSLSQEGEQSNELTKQQLIEETDRELQNSQTVELTNLSEVVHDSNNVSTNNSESKDALDSIIDNGARDLNEPLESCLEQARRAETEHPEKIDAECELDVYEVKGAEEDEEEIQYIDEEAEEEQQVSDVLEGTNNARSEELTTSLGIGTKDSQLFGDKAKNEFSTNLPRLGVVDSTVVCSESKKDNPNSAYKSKTLETESSKFEEISEGSIDQAEQEEVINDMTDVIITGVTFKSRESKSKLSKSHFPSRKKRVPYSEAESLEEVFFATENDDLKMPAEDKDNDDISDSSFSDHVGTNLSLEEISDDDLEPSKKRRKSLGPSLDKNVSHEKADSANRSLQDSLSKSELKSEKGNEIHVDSNKRPASNEDGEAAASKRQKLSEEKDGRSIVDSGETKSEQVKERDSVDMKLKADSQDKIEEATSAAALGEKFKREERSPTETSKLRNLSGGRVSSQPSKQDQYDSKDKAPTSRDYPDPRHRYEMVNCSTQTESKILKGKIVQCNISPIDPYFHSVQVDRKAEDKFQSSKLLHKFRHLLPSSIPNTIFSAITSVKPATKAQHYTFSMGPVTLSDMDSHEFRDVAVKGADKFHLTFDTHCQGIFQSTLSKYENIFSLIKRLKKLELGNRYMCMSFTYNFGQDNEDKVWKATIMFMYEQDIQLETIGLVCDEKIRSKLHLRGLPKGVSKDFINILFPEALSINTISETNERVVSLGFSNTKLVEEILTCYDLVIVNGCQVKMTHADFNDVLIQAGPEEDVVIIDEDLSFEKCELTKARDKEAAISDKSILPPEIVIAATETAGTNSWTSDSKNENSRVSGTEEQINVVTEEMLTSEVSQVISDDVQQGDNFDTTKDTVVTKEVADGACEKENTESRASILNTSQENETSKDDITVEKTHVENSESPIHIDQIADGENKVAACAEGTSKLGSTIDNETESSLIVSDCSSEVDSTLLGVVEENKDIDESQQGNKSQSKSNEDNKDHICETEAGQLNSNKGTEKVNKDQVSEIEGGQLKSDKDNDNVNKDQVREIERGQLNSDKDNANVNKDQVSEIEGGQLKSDKDDENVNKELVSEMEASKSDNNNANVNRDQVSEIELDQLKANKENTDGNLEDVSDEDTMNQSKPNVLATKENLMVVNIDLTNEDSDSSDDMKGSTVPNVKLSGNTVLHSPSSRPEKEKLEMTDGSLHVSMEVIDVSEDEVPEKIMYPKYDKTLLLRSSGMVVKEEPSSGDKWKTESWIRAPQEHRKYDTYHPPTYSKYSHREEYLSKPSFHYQKRHSREVSESKKMTVEEPSRYRIPYRESTTLRRDTYRYDVRSRSPSPRKDSSWYRETEGYRHSRPQYPLDYTSTSRKYSQPSATYDKWQHYNAEGRKPDFYPRHGAETRLKDWAPRSSAYSGYSTWQDHHHNTSRSGEYYMHENKEPYQRERKYVQRRSRSQSYSDMSSSPDHHSPVKRKWSVEKKSPKRSYKHSSRSPISVSSRSRSLSPVSKSPSVGRTQHKIPVKEALVKSVKQFLHLAKDLRENKQQMISISPESSLPVRTTSPVLIRSRSPGLVRGKSPGPIRSRSPVPIRVRSPGSYRVSSPVHSPESPHRFDISRSRHILTSPRGYSRSPPPARLRSSRSPKYSKGVLLRHNRSPSAGVSRHHRSPSPENPRHCRSPSPEVDNRSKRYRTKIHEYSERRHDSYQKESSRHEYSQKIRPSSSPVKESYKTGQWSDQPQYNQSGDQQWQQSYSSYQNKSTTGPPPTGFNPNYPPPGSYPSTGYQSQEMPSTMYQGGSIYQYSNPSQYSYANVAHSTQSPYMIPTPAPPMPPAYQQAFNVIQSAMASQVPQQASFEPSSSNKSSSSSKNKKSWSMGSNAMVFQRILSNEGGKKKTQSGTIEKIADRSRQERPKQTKDVRCLTNVQVNK
ncbi:serine/arginine repetitive matrix protein 2 isoform X1 [Biomphalaria glabrata]|nr:serine/arginine repetitive matrix protein 2 isoform X1 [Biomphalaria glabrata]